MTMVIKYGGSSMTDPEQRQAVAEAIKQGVHEGLRLVVVHGGGPFIEQELQQSGLERRFVRGLRVTSSESLVHIERALTLLGKKLAHEIGGAIALTGRDAGLLFAEEFSAELGRVGRMVGVNSRLLTQLLDIPVTPVIACLAAAGDGGLLNVNADEVAGAVAGALHAPVLFLTNVPGVLDDPADPASVLPILTQADAEARIADGRISGGMIPKVEAALRALAEGAPSALIGDGQTRAAYLAALRGATGTKILAS